MPAPAGAYLPKYLSSRPWNALPRLPSSKYLILFLKSAVTASVRYGIKSQRASDQFAEGPPYFGADSNSTVGSGNSRLKRIYVLSPRSRLSAFWTFLWNAIHILGLFAEVSLKQTLESLAVSCLVAVKTCKAPPKALQNKAFRH